MGDPGLRGSNLGELDTSARTLSTEGLAVTLQLIATHKGLLKIGDVEAAFLRGDLLERKTERS